MRPQLRRWIYQKTLIIEVMFVALAGVKQYICRRMVGMFMPVAVMM